jgi:hypothetical protein
MGTLSLFGCYGTTYVNYDDESPYGYSRMEPARAASDSYYDYDDDGVDPDEEEIDEDVFYRELAPYGNWVDVQEYGRVWAPTRVAAGWRPYTVGHWAYSDNYGWLWVSEEDWGWATYHYGRWVDLPGRGWCWVPGRVWGPAWVAWRSGGGYSGWAPLPPARRGGGVSIGIEFGDVDAIPASHFCFVEERRLIEPRIHRHLVSVHNNTTIIRKTVNRTRIERVNKRVVNRSIEVREVERVSGRRVDRIQVKAVRERGRAREIRGKEVNIYRPRPTVRHQSDRRDDRRDDRRNDYRNDRRDGRDRDNDNRGRSDVRPQARPQVSSPVPREDQHRTNENAEQRRREDTYNRERQSMEDRHNRERQRRTTGEDNVQMARRQTEERQNLENKYRRLGDRADRQANRRDPDRD